MRFRLPGQRTTSEALQIALDKPQLVAEWLGKLAANHKLNMSHAERLAIF